MESSPLKSCVLIAKQRQICASTRLQTIFFLTDQSSKGSNALENALTPRISLYREVDSVVCCIYKKTPS